MSFVSYAQNFEDVVLWRALGDVVAGCYLDIGAQDPVFDSVSMAFYQAGWRGIHVEPTPAYAARLREERPDEVVIEAAVSDAPGPLELHEFCGTGLSTGKSEIATRHVERGFSGQKIIVPCVRLDKLFETTGDIHWMKIDVEGMESEVLASWGKSASRPWVLVIEATFPNTQLPTYELWADEVLKRGYREVYFDGLSRYFLHEDHASLTERFAAPPNVFDGFQVSSRHFATQQFAQDAGNEIGEASRRAEQLQAELSMADDQLATASADADQAQAERAAAKKQALALEEQLAAVSIEADGARAEQLGAIEALAKVREEYSVALDQAWRERHAFEIGLREQWSAKEQEYKQAVASREAELRGAGTKVAALDERASRQATEIERLATAKGTLERKAAEFSKELAALHASYRSEIKAHEERARKERDRLSSKLAQREAELSAAKATTHRHASDIGELKKAKAGLDQQVADLNTEIAALHASHRSETKALEENSQAERDRFSNELAQREAELSAAKATIDRRGSDIDELKKAKAGLDQQIHELDAEIAALHASHRSETSALEERAQIERDRLLKELAQREAELSAAKATIDRRGSDIDELKKAKAGLDRQIAEVNAEITSLNTSHRSEIMALEKRAQAKHDRLSSELTDLDDQLTSEITRLRDDAAGERVELEQKVAQSETRAAAIEALIKTALAQPLGIWQRLGQALGVARKDSARQALLSWRPVQVERFYQSLEPAMQMTAAGAARNPCLPANSLEELIALHDVDFVRCAYVTVLGRQPDAQGEAYYTDRIRRGHSRMSVLSQLRRSDEARSHDPGIIGLDAALAKAARARLPIVGALLPDSSIEPQRDHWKPFRALANQLNLIDDRLTVSLLREAESSRDMKRLSASASAPATIEQILATFGSQADA